MMIRIKRVIRPVYNLVMSFLFRIFGLLPYKDRVVARAFRGKVYGDNPKYIFDEIHKLRPEIELVWVNSTGKSFSMPQYVKEISANPITLLYYYATSKVWIDTAQFNSFWHKRSNQLFIETWHGGLGIKKIDLDVEKFRNQRELVKTNYNTMKMADVCISNSDFMSKVYRSALKYDGVISQCGNAKDDMLLQDNSCIKSKVFSFFGIDSSFKLAIYAPTYRDPRDFQTFNIDFDAYDIDFNRFAKALSLRFGGDWKVLVRLHPHYKGKDLSSVLKGDSVIDAMDYPDMQELILSSDVFISDYSSCLFEAAEREIPCFTYANDFELYKGDRGVYYEMNELPFPYATNNDELEQNVINFDIAQYLEKWKQFAKESGLVITPYSGEFIAQNVVKYLEGKKITWDFDKWLEERQDEGDK